MRDRLLFAAAAAVLLALVAGPTGAHDMQHMTMGAPAEPTSASLYNLESTWTNEDGTSVALSALSGKPVVAAMGYTSCKDMCPAIVADMSGSKSTCLKTRRGASGSPSSRSTPRWIRRRN